MPNLVILKPPEILKLRWVLRVPGEPAASEQFVFWGCISVLSQEKFIRGKENAPEQQEHLNSHLGCAMSLVWCQRSGLVSSVVDLSCDDWNNNSNVGGQEASLLLIQQCAAFPLQWPDEYLVLIVKFLKVDGHLEWQQGWLRKASMTELVRGDVFQGKKPSSACAWPPICHGHTTPLGIRSNTCAALQTNT